jgi:ABC-2 type transport system permease protein
VLRDRVALFFLIVLPIIVIVIVGAVAQGFNTFRVGVVDLDGTQAGRQLVAELSHASGLAVIAYPNLGALDKAVGRSEVNAGVVIPRGLGADERSGKAVAIAILAEQANSTQQAAATQVGSVVENFGGRIEAAQFATRYGGSFSVNLGRATSLEPGTPRVGLASQVIHTTGGSLPPGYGYSAPTELVLFVFLMAVTGGATIVETRCLGMYERMSAAPVRPRTIIAGVISSRSGLVHDVQHVLARPRALRRGRDYLPLVHCADHVEERCRSNGWRHRPVESSHGRCSATTTSRSSQSNGSWRICPTSSGPRTPFAPTRTT